jgi:hypothetical protein
MVGRRLLSESGKTRDRTCKAVASRESLSIAILTVSMAGPSLQFGLATQTRWTSAPSDRNENETHSELPLLKGL